MKRLKYSNGFCGYGQAVSWISIFACLAWSVFFPWLEMNCGWALDESIVLAVYGTLLLAPPLITWLVLHYCLNKAERELVHKAQPPDWQPLSRRDHDHFRYENYFIRFLGMLVVLGLLGLLVLFAELTIPDKAYWFAVYAVITGLCILFTWLDHRLWQGIDESAECTELHVDHSYKRYWHSKTGKHAEYYLVCYLPDGKYIFKDEDSYGMASSIRIVRYRHRIRWYAI